MSSSCDGRYGGNQTPNDSGSGVGGTVGRQSRTAAASPPSRKSTLANLLSSQRRSAAQLDRHRIQRALPFANIHKNNDIVSKISLNSDGMIKNVSSDCKSNNVRKLQTGECEDNTQLRATEPKLSEFKTPEASNVANMSSSPVTDRQIDSTTSNFTIYSSMATVLYHTAYGQKKRARSELFEENNATNNQSESSLLEKRFCRFTPPSTKLSAKGIKCGNTMQQQVKHSNHPHRFFSSNAGSFPQKISRFNPPPSIIAAKYIRQGPKQ